MFVLSHLYMCDMPTLNHLAQEDTIQNILRVYILKIKFWIILGGGELLSIIGYSIFLVLAGYHWGNNKIIVPLQLIPQYGYALWLSKAFWFACCDMMPHPVLPFSGIESNYLLLWNIPLALPVDKLIVIIGMWLT